MENNINFETALRNNINTITRITQNMRRKAMITKSIIVGILIIIIVWLVAIFSSRKDVLAKSTNGDIVRTFSVEKTVRVGDTIYSRLGIPFVVRTDN